MGVRGARLGIALLAIWRLVVDLAAQIVETLAVWTLTHYQPRLDAPATWLGALGTAGREESCWNLHTGSTLNLPRHHSTIHQCRSYQLGDH